ncbi:MAG: IS3 family transposase [Ignavibacteriota bacterium]
MIHNKTDIEINKIIQMIGIHQSKFYSWLERPGKPDFHNCRLPKANWLPEDEKQALLKYAREHLGEGYRRLTCMMTDDDVAAVSPSTTYRILKGYGLPDEFNSVKTTTKGTGFVQPTKPHEHWHTDIKYVSFHGCFLFLISVIDGFSRYIVHHELRLNMQEYDAGITIQRALEKFPGVTPRIISDNGSQFISHDFADFLKFTGLSHVRTSRNYPQSNGKTERFHRTISEECLTKKSMIDLADARRQITQYIEFYNNKRLHSSLYYLTPRDFLNNTIDEKLNIREYKLQKARKNRTINRLAS